MKKISAIFITTSLILSAVALTGCGDSQFTVGWPNADIHGSGKTITADYTGIPSTGYQWTVEVEDENVIKETSHTSKEAKSTESQEMVGTQQVEHFTYEVVGDGETRVVARYARSWEKNDDDLEYIYKVTVKNGKISMMMIDDELTDSIMEMLDGAIPEA